MPAVVTRSSTDITELRRAVAQLRWFHRIDLGDGAVTPGEADTPEKLKTLHLPQDLRGTTVLDIGAWDGCFSFETARRGAPPGRAAGDFCWRGAAWGAEAW